MGTLISHVLTFLFFVLAPSLLLGDEYNFAVGFAYFCAVSGLLSLHFEAVATKAEIKLLNDRFSDWRVDWRLEKDKEAYAPAYRKGAAESYE